MQSSEIGAASDAFPGIGFPHARSRLLAQLVERVAADQQMNRWMLGLDGFDDRFRTTAGSASPFAVSSSSSFADFPAVSL